MQKKKITVAIIEDHSNFREGLVFFINSTEGYACENKFTSVEEALKNFKACDVLLLDIHLPGKTGIEAIPLIKENFPQTKIIMMTVFEDDENIFNSILAGADGYLLKKTPPLKILSAIEDVLEGGAPISPFVAKKVVDYFREKDEIKNDYQLTTREKEILALLVEGTDSRQIAAKLFISYETVRNHLKNIYQKLQVTSKIQAVTKAIKERLIK